MANPTNRYDIDLESTRLLREHTWRFTLSPELWGNLDLPEPLKWSHSKFNQASVVEIPDNRIGVYAFVLEPNIADLNLRYLLYVGKTEKQNFRERFRQYLGHQQERMTNRPLVKQMLTIWPDHLTFYYSPIDDRRIINTIERKLIAVFKPPVCRQYPAAVRGPFKILDGPGG